MAKIRLRAEYRQSLLNMSVCLLSMAATAAVLFAVFGFLGIAPLGSSALLFRDGQNQMTDLFCWFKDVLEGKGTIDYTFTKSLGGSNLAVFAYYLASPFSLLIMLFGKNRVAEFLDVLFIIKTCVAAGTASYYLVRRFKPYGIFRYGVTLVLAMSYALSTYFVCQSSNTMWLDGAYLLPVVLAGVEKLAEGRKSTQLIVSLAFGLCFNWYTGVINVMFAGIWLVFDIVRRIVSDDETDEKGSICRGIPSGALGVVIVFIRFIISCICSAVISCAILLPTLYMLSERTYGKSDLSALTDLRFIGKVIDVVSNYAFGNISTKGSPSLFAGSFVFIGIVLLFIAGWKNIKEKIVYGVFLLFTVMIFYWQPLVSLFSLLREVESFWYRYAYVGIFALIFISASFYLDQGFAGVRPWMPAVAAAGLIIIATIMGIVCNTAVNSHQILFASTVEDLTGGARIDYETVPVVCKLIFPALISVLMYVCIFAREEKRWFRYVLSCILAGAIVFELALGQAILARIYSTENGSSDLARYIKCETALLDAVPDSSFVRRVQTTYHGTHSEAPLYTSYNEPMAFGFNSVTSFVSDPEEPTTKFLDKAGYPAYKDTINVTSSENLALDSLLGVKYVMLAADDTDNAGLQYIAGIEGFKNIYSNPAALPVAFKYNWVGNYDSDKTDPAEYLNDMYRVLTGTEEDIFTGIEFEETSEGINHEFKAVIPEDMDLDRKIIYADFATDSSEPAVMYINGNRYSDCFRFLAPSFVRVAADDQGNASVRISFEKYKGTDEIPVNASFWVLDLDVLEEAAKSARLDSVSRQVIEDGYARFEVNNAKAGQSLFTSIPYERGWEISLNGKPVNFQLIGGTLISVPLEEGNNMIEMKYEIPYKQTGLYISIGGVVMFIVILAAEELLRTRNRRGD